MAKFRTIKAKRAAVARFFADNATPTVSGLAGALRMRRIELAGYTGHDPVLLEALGRIEAFLEARAYGPNSPGYIFGLKNNFGWRDVRAAAESPKPPAERSMRELSNEELMAIIDGTDPGPERRGGWRPRRAPVVAVAPETGLADEDGTEGQEFDDEDADEDGAAHRAPALETEPVGGTWLDRAFDLSGPSTADW